MAKQTSDVNKSEEVRRLLRTNPNISVKDAINTLGERGITIGSSLFYFVKGKMKGRESRRQKAHEAIVKVATASAPENIDAVATIRKVKAWANEVGGMRKLKALVEALSE